MSISMSQFPSIEQMTGQLVPGKKITQGHQNVNGNPFHEILKEKQEALATRELKFSKHANDRLAQRNIDLTDDQFKRLETGARKAGEKGITETLVMVDDLAFIVNVNNNTVITAVNDGKERVFTNIDGAVIV